jgi:hypothetical protein
VAAGALVWLVAPRPTPDHRQPHRNAAASTDAIGTGRRGVTFDGAEGV